MSESISTVQLAAYLLRFIPGVYFLYKIVKEVYYHFNSDDKDIL